MKPINTPAYELDLEKKEVTFKLDETELGMPLDFWNFELIAIPFNSQPERFSLSDRHGGRLLCLYTPPSEKLFTDFCKDSVPIRPASIRKHAEKKKTSYGQAKDELRKEYCPDLDKFIERAAGTLFERVRLHLEKAFSEVFGFIRAEIAATSRYGCQQTKSTHFFGKELSIIVEQNVSARGNVESKFRSQHYDVNKLKGIPLWEIDNAVLAAWRRINRYRRGRQALPSQQDVADELGLIGQDTKRKLREIMSSLGVKERFNVYKRRVISESGEV